MIKYSDIKIGDYLKAAYEGKMWKSKYKNGWLLNWFGISEKLGFVSNNCRILLISE